MRKNKIILFLIFLLVLSINSIAQEKWTLEKCVNRAIKKNISIKQSSEDLKSNQLNKKTAIGNFMPNFNLSGSHAWNVGLNQNITTGLLENMTTESSSLSANIGIDIFKGLQNLQQLYRTNLSILASTYQLEDMKDDISLLVANAYLQILFDKENMLVQESQLTIAKEELIITQEKIKNGVIPSGSVLEIEANLASVEQGLLLAKNKYYLSKMALAQLLLITDVENFEIDESVYLNTNNISNSILNQDISSIYNSAVKNRNDIKLAQTNLKIFEKDLAINKSIMFPSIKGFYYYNTRFLLEDSRSFSEQIDANAGQNFGLQISIPLFNNMLNHVNVQKSKINLKKAEYTLKQMKLDLENTITQAYKDAEGAFKTYEAANKTFYSRELAYKYAKERFNNGAINTFNFLQSQQKFKESQSELIKTKYNYIFKIKILEFYFGDLDLYYN